MAVPLVPDSLADLAETRDDLVRKPSTLWADAWRRLIRNRLAVLGLIIVVSFVLIAVLAPVLAPYGESEVVDPRLVRASPSWTWPMGLDQNGRDMFSRIMYGARVSLLVGVVAYLIVLLIAIPIGSIAGYYGGWVDNVMMRFVDVVFTIPQVLLVLMLVNWRGPGLINIFLAIGVIGWVTEARLIRGQFLTLRGTGLHQGVSRGWRQSALYHQPAPAAQQPDADHRGGHLRRTGRDFTEAAVSFAGVGIRPPDASWGQMVGTASQTQYIRTDPHMLLFPVLAIGLTMLGFTFLGDGLRDALDPKGND